MEIAKLPDGQDELLGLKWIIEDELASRDAAKYVVDGSWEKQAGMSRREIPPMRGQDPSILPPQAHDATMR